MVRDALQRGVVRMLHDPALVERVYAGEDLPGVSPEEMRWVRAVDRRAWGADAERPARVMYGLVGEFPVAVAERGTAGLLGFFADPAFARAVESGSPLPLAFAGWLGDRPFARLERAFAHARRGRGEPGRPPGVWLLSLPAGTLAAWSRVRPRLDADRVLAGARVRAPTEGREEVLVHGDAAEVVPPDLAAVLRARDPGREARRRGATPAEARSLVADLVAEGILGRR